MEGEDCRDDDAQRLQHPLKRQHQDVVAGSWKQLSKEELDAVRGGGHWRRRSSSLLVFDDWAAPPTELSDLQPAPISLRQQTSLARRASARSFDSSLLQLPALQQPLVRRVPSSRAVDSRLKPLQRVEEPLGGEEPMDDGQDIQKGDYLTPPTSANQVPDDTFVETSNNWILYAIGVMVMGVGASLPFNAMLAADPGSPLFVAFVTHVFLVVCNLNKVLPTILVKNKHGRRTTLPFTYHAACVVLGFAYNILRADALTRLPPAVAMMLLNGRMLIGMACDCLLWGNRYSVDQVVSAAIIIMGIVWSGLSTSSSSSSNNSAEGDGYNDGINMAIGAAELIVGMICVTFLLTTVKIGFQRYGECPEEQVLFQHLLALPLFYLMESQWQHIGPRLEAWIVAKDWFKAALLISNLTLTFGHTHSLALFTARAPNMLLYQIVDTVKKFVIVVVTALGRAPPWPPAGFWGGSMVLVMGTMRFLSVSQPPKEEGMAGQVSDVQDDEDAEPKKEK